MRATLCVMAALVVASCDSVRPVPVNEGDICYRCRRVITDARLAGEIVTETKHAYKFKAPGCMAQFLAKNPELSATVFVTDYLSGHMIDPERAYFVRTVVDEATGEKDFAAFGFEGDARYFARSANESLLTWDYVRTCGEAMAAGATPAVVGTACWENQGGL